MRIVLMRIVRVQKLAPRLPVLIVSELVLSRLWELQRVDLIIGVIVTTMPHI